jgi:hypothetical protein
MYTKFYSLFTYVFLSISSAFEKLDSDGRGSTPSAARSGVMLYRTVRRLPARYQVPDLLYQVPADSTAVPGTWYSTTN